MVFEDWLKTVPAGITDDSLWGMMVYRQALYLGDLAWFDVCKLAQGQAHIGAFRSIVSSGGRD